MSKCFYKTATIEMYNGYRVHHNIKDLHYGEMPNVDKTISFDTYEEMADALAHKRFWSAEFYAEYSAFAKKYFLYSTSWLDGMKVKPKNFSSYSQRTKVVQWHPTWDQVVHELPVEDLLDWYKDNNIIINDGNGILSFSEIKQQVEARKQEGKIYEKLI